MESCQSNLLPEFLLLGIPHVDAQHEGVFYRLEHVKLAALATNSLPHPLVNDLLVYLEAHFRTEAALAESAGLDFSEHAASHRQTLSVLNRWIGKVQTGELDIFSFLRYLEIWFERHIRDEDQPFGRELLASGRPISG